MPPKPNVVFILLDDMGWGDPGSYGGTFVLTPEMDQLATEGMRFTEHYANGPVCSPSRVGIHTGLYPQTFGIRRVIPGSTSSRGVPNDVLTLAKLLNDAGYVTGHVGKWHMGLNKPDYLPLSQGYDGSALFIQDDENLSYWDPTFLIDDGDTEILTFPGEHLTRVTTDFAIEFILAAQAAGPFFVSIWYNAPHAPYEPTPAWAAQYPDTTNGRYAAMISDVDEQIGELVDLIDTLGLGSDTVVIVTSDNGSGHTSIASNGPYTGQKQDIYEGGIRAPLFVRWPNSVPAGMVNQSISLGFDFLPTFAAHLGVPLATDPGSARYPGKSLLPAWLDNKKIQRLKPLYWESKDANSFFTPLDGELNRFGVRVGRWKLVRQDNAINDESLLFNLHVDPFETTDVSDDNRLFVQYLERQYRLWRFEVGTLGYGIANIQGQVSVGQDVYAFQGGRVELENDTLFDLDDGDFSFQARISNLTGTPGFGNDAVIAERPGSWTLSLTTASELQLDVKGQSGNTTLTSAPLPPGGLGSELDVAFTIFGWRDSNSTVRLYVDGVLEVETNAIDVVESNDNPIYLGNSESMDAPFFGVMREMRLYLLSLTVDEVRDDDGDGFRNAQDDCPFIFNPGQEDNNGNYAGDACEGIVKTVPVLPGPALGGLVVALLGLGAWRLRTRV